MTEEQKNSDIKEENTPQKRAWWEIPARGAVFFVILFVMMPGHWYRAAYLYTIGRLFPVSMESRISKISDKVQRRLDLQEIPSELRILVLKAEKQVELWGKMSSGTWKKINYYPIFSLPEGVGPKLRKEELKTPEGIYKIASLDPDHLYALAIKLDYPSQEDLNIAAEEKRSAEDMKTDVLLHGFGYSKKHISMTNSGMEELFYLIHKVGQDKTMVLVSPCDYRKDYENSAKQPWLKKRYEEMKKLMSEMQKTKEKKDAASGKN